MLKLSQSIKQTKARELRGRDDNVDPSVCNSLMMELHGFHQMRLFGATNVPIRTSVITILRGLAVPSLHMLKNVSIHI